MTAGRPRRAAEARRAPPSSETARSPSARPPRGAEGGPSPYQEEYRGSEGRGGGAFQRAASSPSPPESGSIFRPARVGIIASALSASALSASALALSLAAGVVPLGDRLFHGRIHVLAEVLPHLVPHPLHEARHTARVVLIEIAVLGGIGERLQAGILGLDRGEAGHEARQLEAPAPGTSGRGGRGRGEHEQAHPPATSVAFILVNRHAALLLPSSDGCPSF